MSPPSHSSFAPAPFRVAHLVRPSAGGMRAQVRGLLAAFPQSLLAAPPDGCEFCADVVPDPNDRLPLLFFRRPDQLLRSGARAGKWAKQRGAHVLHGHGLQWLPLFAAAQAESGLPLVVTMHNIVPADLSNFQKLVLRVALRRAAKIISVSHAVAASVRSLVGSGASDTLVVVRNGIDLRRFANDMPPATAVRADLNLPLDALVVICVARLSPEKGLETLLQSVALLHPNFPNVRVLLAGDGPQKNELQTMARQSVQNTVRFLGQIDDVPRLLRAADVYVQPSYSEGLGLAVLEAMASGLPVVASRVGGLPEVVADGEIGLLVPPGDAPALANALAALLADPARRTMMGHAGRARVASCFSVERMVSETRAVYESVCPI